MKAVNIRQPESCDTCKFKKLIVANNASKELHSVCAKAPPHVQIFLLNSNGQMQTATHSCQPPLPMSHWCGEWTPGLVS